MKLVLTGGHLTPAVAFMQNCVGRDEILFFGRKYASKDAAIKSKEKAEVENLGFTFVEIEEIKYNRHQKLKSFLKSPLIIWSIAFVIQELKDFKPDAILTFGASLSIPVILAGKLLKIPIYIHEQTTRAGLANRLTSPFARHLFLSYPNTPGFPKNNIPSTVVGNFIRQEFFKPSQKPNWIAEISNKPILFITGGNQGSMIINQYIVELIPQLLTHYQLIIQTGSAHDNYYFNLINQIKHNLTATKKSQIVVRQWFEESEQSWILHHARLVISRSGANTISELMVTKTPAILIPLPHTENQEQENNARIISMVSAGIILNQDQLSSNIILDSIKEIETHYSIYQNNYTKIEHLIDPNSVPNTYQIIQRNFNENQK